MIRNFRTFRLRCLFHDRKTPELNAQVFAHRKGGIFSYSTQLCHGFIRASSAFTTATLSLRTNRNPNEGISFFEHRLKVPVSRVNKVSK